MARTPIIPHQTAFARTRLCAILLAGAALGIAACSGSEPQTEVTGDAAEGMSELEKGMARMETQEVLVLADAPLDPLAGVEDVWEYTLAPYESIEFKYTIAQDQPIVFHWQATGEVHYDMHSHPFDGGTELTESYALGDAEAMQGRYIPAFTGIHGWFFENRTLEDVTVRLDASGAMTSSTIYSSSGSVERPLEGVEPGAEAGDTAAGHSMLDS